MSTSRQVLCERMSFPWEQREPSFFFSCLKALLFTPLGRELHHIVKLLEVARCSIFVSYMTTNLQGLFLISKSIID